MVHRIDVVPLKSTSAGTERRLKVHRIGVPGARPKVHVQAGLHANEIPGLLIAHHLLALALEADRQGLVTGEIVILPYANPIGLSDNVLGNQIGREALDGGGNYNRGWPDLAAAILPLVGNRLGPDPAANVTIVRQAIRDALDAMQPATEIQFMQHALLRLASDADLLIDLHTELQAVAGAVVAPWCLEAMSGLIAELDPALVHVTDTPPLFDSVCSRPWHAVGAASGPDRPVPQALAGITVEMRGVTDVSDELARADAQAIFRHLMRSGIVSGDPGPAPEWKRDITPHEAIFMMRSPAAGVIVYPQPLGTRVEAGAIVAEIVDPDADEPEAARTPIRTHRPGLIYATVLNRLVRPNDIVIKIAATDTQPAGAAA